MKCQLLCPLPLQGGLYAAVPVDVPSPLAGEGSSAARTGLIWVRGTLRERYRARRQPLIRRFAPPSPTRGEGKRGRRRA
ncbi:hypothetical protein CWO90_26900 [Bradyrhizobium sp. Leo121]|nr:hypothetical protein CWO90_26900 [Bradyrhizobium sp. Leo121]